MRSTSGWLKTSKRVVFMARVASSFPTITSHEHRTDCLVLQYVLDELHRFHHPIRLIPDGNTQLGGLAAHLGIG